MRVLVVTVVHDPEDARIRHRELASLLAEGHQVTYAAPFGAYGRSVPPGVTGLDLPRAQGRRRLRALRAARATVHREASSYDLVLLHDPELLLTLPGTGLGRSSRPTVVWDVHEDSPATVGLKGWLPGPVRPLVAGALGLLERWAERRVHLTLAEYGYADRFRHPHPVVPNTVPVPADEPPPPGRDRVVYVGRLTRARGALEVVRLGELLAGEVRVELVGNADPEVEPAVRDAHRAGSVDWRGFLPNDQALRRTEGALAGLALLHDQPNYRHSRFTKVMEYMAHGIPVITTPNPAAADFVTGHGCGLVVPFDDPEAAAEAVRRLRDDSALRERLGAAGRRVAVTELSWERDGREFARLLEGWAGQAGARR